MSAPSLAQQIAAVEHEIVRRRKARLYFGTGHVTDWGADHVDALVAAKATLDLLAKGDGAAWAAAGRALRNKAA